MQAMAPAGFVSHSRAGIEIFVRVLSVPGASQTGPNVLFHLISCEFGPKWMIFDSSCKKQQYVHVSDLRTKCKLLELDQV
jgi:hypothetical protein